MTQRITYLGKQIYPRQTRDRKGRYSHRRFGFALFVLAAVLLFTLAAPTFSSWLDNQNKLTYFAPPPVYAAVTMEAKVESLKEQIVNDIAACETKGVKEPDATILLDSNSQMSLGSWQWQIKSIQHYVKLFEGRAISRVEAINIATDHQKAKDLTTKVLFGEKDGWKNWYTCGVKLDVGTKIDLISALER